MTFMCFLVSARIQVVCDMRCKENARGNMMDRAPDHHKQAIRGFYEGCVGNVLNGQDPSFRGATETAGC